MPVRIKIAAATERVGIPASDINGALLFLMRDGSAHVERRGVPIDVVTVQNMKPEDYGGCEFVIFDDSLYRAVVAELTTPNG